MASSMVNDDISQLVSNMDMAGNPDLVKLLGLLVASGTVDLNHPLEDGEFTVAQAIGGHAVDNGNAHTLLQIQVLIGPERTSDFFDWKTHQGEHIASRKVKELNTSGKKTNDKSKPDATAYGRLDEWVGLLCWHKNPLRVLDTEALIVCVGSRMPQTHDALAEHLAYDHRLPDGSLLWSRARSCHQFDLINHHAKGNIPMPLLIELSDACEQKRARGKASQFAMALDLHILDRLNRSSNISISNREWIDERLKSMAIGKNAKWAHNDVLRAWVRAWVKSHPGRDMGDNMRTMLLERKAFGDGDIAEHLSAIMGDQPLLQAVGMDAIRSSFLNMAYQRFRGTGSTGVLKMVQQHDFWPRQGAPHLLRFGLVPCGGQGSKSSSHKQLGEALNASGDAVWGQDRALTAGKLVGRIRDIIVNGGDGEKHTTAQDCLNTLRVVLQDGSGPHEPALRFCGALATYMVVNKSTLSEKCLQVMAETREDIEEAIAKAGGQPIHEIADDVMVILKNSKKRESFQAFKSMLDMRANTAVPDESTAKSRGPRF